MSWKFRKPLKLFDLSTLMVIGCLSSMMSICIADSSPDTCGDYFFLPMFPECELFIEAVPCFNDTPTVIVTMTTPAGKFIRSFPVTFGAMAEISLSSFNEDKHEGLIARSNDDISLYMHKTSGDSMIIFPIDAFARAYEIPRMKSSEERQKNGSSSSSSSGSSKRNGRNGALYIFSPFNNTSISIIPINDGTDSTGSSSSSSSSSSSQASSTSSSSSSFSSITIKLDAFEIQKYYTDTSRRYRLLSKDMFGVVLVQTLDTFVPNDTICRDVTLSLLDFVPPYSIRGRHFYIAFPNLTDFTVFILGQANTSLDLTTDMTSREILVDQSGTNISDVSKTSSAWISASHPVSVYIKVTICSNASSPSLRVCEQNGFFLPSIEHYFTCKGNNSKLGCVCTCPSVFQRDIDPHSFHFFGNMSDSRPTSIYPLSVGELFDVTTTIVGAAGFTNVDDVILTTNTSFLIFRHDLENLNFLPAGSLLVNVYSLCSPDSYNILFQACEDTVQTESKPTDDTDQQITDYSEPELDQCSCEFIQDSFMLPHSGQTQVMRDTSGERPKVRYGGTVTWDADPEDTARPLIAVVVSLCVSILAVIALISGYMLVEMVSRRKHVRNTKIRPFVS